MVDNPNKNFNKSSINLRTDFNGVNFKLENLNAWTCQNFTELLNRPRKLNSADQKATIKNTQIQIDLDLERISDISSTKSGISQNSANSSNKPFKVLIAEDYSEYLEKIKKYFSTFKFNHYSKYYTMIKNSYISNNTMYASSMILNNLIEEPANRSIEVYIPSNKLKEINLSHDYFKSEKEFKIERMILEKNIDEIEAIMKQFIEREGILEMEVQRIMNHGGLIVGYIEKHLDLKSQVEFFLEKIKRHREFKQIIKKALVMNTSRTLIKGNRKRKIESLLDLLKNIKHLRDVFENLKIISNLKEENKLIQRGKEILGKLKIKNIKIVSILQKEFINYTSKSSEKIIEEFAKLFKKTFSDLISFEIENSEYKHNVDDYKYNIEEKILISKDKISKVLDNINYRKINELPNFPLKKFQEILTIFTQDQNETNLTRDKFIEILKGPLNKIKKLIQEILIEINDKIYKSLRNIKASKEENKTDVDHLFLVILIKCLTWINENFALFYNLIYEDFYIRVHWDKGSLESKEVKQFLELPKFLCNEINKNIQSAIDRNLGEDMNDLKIEDFLREYNEMKDICESYMKEFNLSHSDLFSKYESEFLFQFFISSDEKFREITEKEDWNQFSTIPITFDKLFNFIVEGQLFKYKTSGEPLPVFDLSLNKPSETEVTNMVKIDSPNGSFKSTLSCLEIIAFIYEIVKLINYLDIGLIETIIYQLVKIMKHYLTACKEFIIDGEGVKRGKMKSITQKHIVLLNSDSIILLNLINHISKNISSEFPSKFEIVQHSLKDLQNIIGKLNQDCKEKIYDLFYQTIEESLSELSKIDFTKYPVLNKSEYNQYCIKFYMFKTVYNHMINGFSYDDIVQIYTNNFTIYFDKLEKLLVNLSKNFKIESEGGYKQLKSDLLFFKKFLKQFELIDTTVFKEKIDVIMKSVLPPKLLKTKKNLNRSAIGPEDN